MKLELLLFFIAFLVSAAFLPVVHVYYQIENRVSSEVFFLGVIYGSNSTREAELLINKVKDYSNLFIVGSRNIATNETALTEICDYAVDAGMSAMCTLISSV